MPGTIMHLTVAQMVYEGIKDLELDKMKFLMGNILPDEAADKERSHFRVRSSVERYMLPHMGKVKEELFRLNDPYRLGAYCHLYFDYHFFEDYLFKMFIWDSENDLVISKQNGISWQTDKFWSRSVFYSAYGAINHPIIDMGLINMEDVGNMAEPIPHIGNERFDARREKTWKTELYEFLESKPQYTGEIIELDPTVEFMRKIANDLIEEIKMANNA